MGKRKGLDITFGNNINYGGIIIRAIQKINNEGKCEPIEGPCNVVKYILGINEEKEKKYKGFVEEIEKHDIFENNKIKLDFNNVDNKKYYKAPRVGINPARNKPDWECFIMKNYRYFVKHTNSCNYPSKDRELIILSLKKNHKFTVDCIKKFFSFRTENKITKYLKYYDKGNNIKEKKNNNQREEFLNDLSKNTIKYLINKKCILYGLLNEGA